MAVDDTHQNLKPPKSTPVDMVVATVGSLTNLRPQKSTLVAMLAATVDIPTSPRRPRSILADMVGIAVTPTSPRPQKLIPVGVMVDTPMSSKLPPLTPMVEMRVVTVAAFMRTRLLRKRLMVGIREGTEGIPIRRLILLMFLMVAMVIECMSRKGEWG